MSWEGETEHDVGEESETTSVTEWATSFKSRLCQTLAVSVLFI